MSDLDRLTRAIDDGLVPQTSSITLIMPDSTLAWPVLSSELSAWHPQAHHSAALSAQGIAVGDIFSGDGVRWASLRAH
jgi:hypothetical protein